MSELKPCPFCGGEAELRYHPSSMRDPECRAWEAGCSICDARVGSTIYAIGKTKQDAIAAWNRRAVPPTATETNKLPPKWADAPTLELGA